MISLRCRVLTLFSKCRQGFKSSSIFSVRMAGGSIIKNILIEKLQESVKEQGDIVRKMKESGENVDLLSKEVEKLKLFKRELEEAVNNLLLVFILEKSHVVSEETVVNRPKLEDLLKRRFFYTPAFEIYGGVSGLYDFGPMGASLEANIMNLWRRRFVIEEQMLEVRCTQLTPSVVLEASGHVEKFVDYMVTDTITGDCFRADHLVKANLEAILNSNKQEGIDLNEIKNHLRQLDNYKGVELDNLISEHKMTSPNNGNPLSKSSEFNLMFGTSIGPTSSLKGYLRPETAQGIFLNFKRLLEFNNHHLPFASAQIGCGFRNEISPRSGLLRFLMAEIEHFVDPENKNHEKFDQVHDTVLCLYSSASQLSGSKSSQITIKDAVEKNIVANSTIGYFMAKIHLFLLEIGIQKDKLRFRQHLPNEMAHYACDCWDAEIKTSYGWIECVGCADRGCYDLTQHSKKSKERLVARRELTSPIKKNVRKFVLDRAELGKEFRKDSAAIISHLLELSESEITNYYELLKSNGYCLNLKSHYLRDISKAIDIEPHVIEPSFGIGRIMYSLLEHSFRTREDDPSRNWLMLPSVIAPVKCAILPLSKKAEFEPYVKTLGSIGRRYARTDEIGIPFIFTVDFDTVNRSPVSVTLRERDSTEQIRVQIEEAVKVVEEVICGKRTWCDLVNKYGLFQGQVSIGE